MEQSGSSTRLSISRILRPKRRTSYKNFFKLHDARTASNSADVLALPTPVSIEDSVSKPALSSVVTSSSSKGLSIVSPKSTDAEGLKSDRKRRKVEKSAGRAAVADDSTIPNRPTASYLECLALKIRVTASCCSWLQRKNKYIHQPSSELDDMYLNELEKIVSLSERRRGIKMVNELLDTSKEFDVALGAIKAGQKNRDVGRRDLIELVILPIVNSYGMHHETLYIAVNILDRFLAISFVFKKSGYVLAAASAAFLAVKYNEEFDPDFKTLVKVLALQNITKRDLLAMERKMIEALDWTIRPLTPHVIAYKILDAMHGYFPLGFKRYIVNLVERIVLSAYCSDGVFGKAWNLRSCTLRALDFAYKSSGYLSLYKLYLNSNLDFGMDCKAMSALLDDESCTTAAYLPVVYGSPIILPEPFNWSL